MTVLFSIKPEFVERIFRGDKLFEYRKIIPRQEITKMIIYASSPISKIVGEVDIVDNILCDTPKRLWETTQSQSGISREFFFSYFNNRDKAYAIPISNPKRYDIPKKIDVAIPQSFCYYNR